MTYLNTSRSQENTIAFTTLFCDHTLWLHQSSWEPKHHYYFVLNRKIQSANIFLPNRRASESSRWVLIIDDKLVGWAEFHFHNRVFSINHLILSPNINWARSGQQSLAYLLASLFQAPNIDLIEIPHPTKSTFPIWGETRRILSPTTGSPNPFKEFEITQIDSQWIVKNELGKKAAQRVRPLLNLQKRNIIRQKKRRPNGRLFSP